MGECGPPSLEDAINRIVKRAAVLAATVCSIAALSVTAANAAPHSSGQGFYPLSPTLAGCGGGMDTFWNNGDYNVQAIVSAVPDTSTVTYLCTAQLYRNQGGWGPLGPSITVSNGGSATGQYQYGDNGTLAHVCITQQSFNLIVHKPTGTVTNCTNNW